MKRVTPPLAVAALSLPLAAQFTQLGPLPDGVVGHAMVAAQGHVYVLGGLWHNSGATAWVQRAAVSGSGTLGPWSRDTALPQATFFHAAVATSERIYVLGGWTVGFVASDRVHHASVGSDGAVGPWVETTPLPRGVIGHAAVETGGWVYVTGGWTGSEDIADVVRAPIRSDGSLGPWQFDSALPLPLYGHAAITTDRMHVLGGVVDQGTLVTADSLAALVLGDHSLGTWSTTTPLLVGIAQHTAVRRESRVFVLGGYDGSNSTSAVASVSIGSDGLFGSWTPRPPLPQPLHGHAAAVVDDYVYVTGGTDGSTFQPGVYSMDLSICQGDVYVDDDATGIELGTAAQPFDRVFEGLAEACAGGTLWIAAGIYDEPTPLTISQAVTLKSAGGTVELR